MEYTFEVIPVMDWIKAREHLLQPPVCNTLMHNLDLKTMFVGGPNTRTDFHLNTTEEWFYQLKGDMVLRVIDGGQFKSIPIHEGQCMLLPGGVPHSPQRTAGSIGLVMERCRSSDDGLRWYCKPAPQDVEAGDAVAGCGKLIVESRFACQDLVSQLKTAIEGYYGDEKLRTCECGRIDVKPKNPLRVPEGITDDGAISGQPEGPYGSWGLGEAKIGSNALHPLPINEWVSTDGVEGNMMPVERFGSGFDAITEGQSVIFCVSGNMHLELENSQFDKMPKSVVLSKDQLVLLPPGTHIATAAEKSDGRCVKITAK